MDKEISSNEIFKNKDIYKYLHDLISKTHIGDQLIIEKPKKINDHGFLGISLSQFKYIIINNFSYIFSIESEDQNKIILKKSNNSPYDETFKNGITFGFITNNSDHPNINKAIHALSNFNLNYEIIIVGDEEKPEKDRVRKIKYQEQNKRFLINKKKSVIINNSSKENICIMHDHILVDAHFIENLLKYGNNFHFYDTLRYSKKLNKEVFSSRNAYHKAISFFGIRSSINNQKYISDSSFINGSFIMGKSELFKTCKWPEHLAWGELEDVHFSKSIFLNGYYISLDKNNRIFSTGLRIKEINRLQGLKNLLKFIFK